MAPPASSSGTHRCSFHVEGNRLSTVAQVGRVRREGDVVMTRYLLPSTLLEILSHAGKKVAASDFFFTVIGLLTYPCCHSRIFPSS